MFKSAGRAPVYVPRCSYGSRISRFDWGELGLDGRFWRVCGTNGEPAVYGWPEANTVRRIFIRIGGAACPDIAGGRPGAVVSQGRPRPGRAEQPAARTRRPAFPRGCREQGRRGRASSASPVSSRPTATSGWLSSARRKTLGRRGSVGAVHDRALGQAGDRAHTIGSAGAARGPFPGRQEPRAGSSA